MRCDLGYGMDLLIRLSNLLVSWNPRKVMLTWNRDGSAWKKNGKIGEGGGGKFFFHFSKVFFLPIFPVFFQAFPSLLGNIIEQIKRVQSVNRMIIVWITICREKKIFIFDWVISFVNCGNCVCVYECMCVHMLASECTHTKFRKALEKIFHNTLISKYGLEVMVKCLQNCLFIKLNRKVMT